jgi:hypothetical protein
MGSEDKCAASKNDTDKDGVANTETRLDLVCLPYVIDGDKLKVISEEG